MSALWRVPRDAVVILTDEFVDALPTFAVAMSLAAGGLVAAYLVQRIGECLTGKQSHTNYKRTTTLAEKKTEKDWKAVTVRSRNGWIRLIAMLISLGLATAGFWVGAQSAGFNFWTLIIGYGIFSVVLGSAFGGALSDIGTFFLISLTDAVEEGQYILLHGMGLEMKITAIHFLWIEGVYVDSTLGKVEIHVPTSTLMRNTFLRVFSKESAYERVTPDPDDVYVGSKLGHGLRDAGKIV
jgi:small-conductance mechanosensitive channel